MVRPQCRMVALGDVDYRSLTRRELASVTQSGQGRLRTSARHKSLSLLSFVMFEEVETGAGGRSSNSLRVSRRRK